ncbi:MAG: type II toxin-antitoxin system RelE/ParE family toxin [Hoeflea sp.]|nr:type II toxin-antitoxin system RelE/ParE family toxin [Hoeflea sp.]
MFVFGQQRWGETNATSYIHELFVIFGHIGQHTQIGRRRPELGDGLRSFPHGSHVIFFMDWQGKTAIVRVLHGSRDHAALFENSNPLSSLDQLPED